MRKHSTDKCYLEYDEEGYLTCTYNHKIGEECLMHRSHHEEAEFYDKVFNMAEFMNRIFPEIKTDPRHLDPRDEDFKEIERSLPFKMFLFGKAVSRFIKSIKEALKIK